MTRLNTISSPARRKKPKRVGRGIGSGPGKTCGRGHKGQRARAGGRRDGAFEGGQMPLHRRVPKRGFVSRTGLLTARVRLSDIARLQRADAEFSEVSLVELKRRGVVAKNAKHARLFLAAGGIALSRAVKVSGVTLSASARAAVVAAGGEIADAPDSRLAKAKKTAKAAAKVKQSAAAKKTQGAVSGSGTDSDSRPAEKSAAKKSVKESAAKTVSDSSPAKKPAAKKHAKESGKESAKKSADEKPAAKKSAAKKSAKKSSDSGTKP